MRLEEHLSDCDEDLKQLILTITRLCRTIAAGFATRQGKAGSTNIYGEQQVKMDVWADEVITKGVKESGLARYLASEEQPDVIEFPDAKTNFGVVMDPLDGSSLIGVNLTVGTIIGIFEGNVLSPGREMVGAMYVLYGPLTTLTYTVKKGVHEFVVNEDGDFVLLNENLTMPEKGKIFGPGALRKEYLPSHMKFIERLEEDGYKIRFSGSFVADVHQILHKGGVFTYPGFVGREQGKLRLLFEAFPMGFIVTQAGGRISDGHKDLLTIPPDGVAHRIPIYAGSKHEIEIIENLNKEA